MQLKPLAFLVLLACGGAAQAGAYYDPTNAASNSGKTTGFELYKTIGCPGRGLLEPPCPGDVAAPKPAPAPVPTSAPVAKPAPVPVSKPVPMPVDSDGDGVTDDKDRCPNTPKGAKVNMDGCELDGDGDGVVDRLDKCPTTPAGRKVDAMGCELDGDGDGVVDALDKCPTTPAGHKVNAMGCDLDSDGDGVIDRLDQCQGTPAGSKVDDRGCSLTELLILRGVNFDNDLSELRPDAQAILERAVANLKANPGVKVEIGGHTDSRNSDWYNLGLGERRAQVVMQYLISQGIDASRLTAKSYGESQPVADNETEEGRMENRRVELRIME